MIGPPPDNARANVATLENLPAKAAELEGTLVRTEGIVEAVAADGTWLVLHDPLFDGWGVVVVREERLRMPAGTRGCVARVEGTLERVTLDEREAALQREQGRPEESFSEDGNEPHLVLVGIEMRKP